MGLVGVNDSELGLPSATNFSVTAVQENGRIGQFARNTCGFQPSGRRGTSGLFVLTGDRHQVLEHCSGAEDLRNHVFVHNCEGALKFGCQGAALGIQTKVPRAELDLCPTIQVAGKTVRRQLS
jgi:hypothetical protein